MFYRDCFPRPPEDDSRLRTCSLASNEENQPNLNLLPFYKCLLYLESQEDANGYRYIVVKDYYSAAEEICFLGIVLKFL